jgi:hypothetical protein
MGLISMKVKSIIKIIKIIIITNKETYLFPTALAADSDTLVDTFTDSDTLADTSKELKLTCVRASDILNARFTPSVSAAAGSAVRNPLQNTDSNNTREDSKEDTLVETSAVVAPAASEDAGESYH